MLKKLSLFFIVLVMTAPFCMAQAQWQDEGIPVIDKGEELLPQVISDGVNGAYVAWLQEKTEFYTVVAQRIDADGNMLWDAEGVTLCSMIGVDIYADPTLYPPFDIALSSDGGLIAAIGADTGGESVVIRAQKVDKSGNILWNAEEGMGVTKSIYPQYMPRIISDGSGGAYIAWSELDNYEVDVPKLQRLNSSGDKLFGDNGISAGVEGEAPDIVSDSFGGVFITWGYPGGGIIAQRVNSSGSLLWDSEGIPVSDGPEGVNPKIINDGNGNAIISWYTEESMPAPFCVHSRKINGSGSPEWDVITLTENPAAMGVQAVSDESGGVIVTWYDGGDGGIKAECVYAQRLDSDGNNAWAPGGVTITPDPYAAAPRIVKDGTGGAIITWFDSGGMDCVYAQRVSAEGSFIWGEHGVTITASSSAMMPSIASDGDRGAYIAWFDNSRGGDTEYHVYAQRVNGYVTKPDVPADQGGSAKVQGGEDGYINPNSGEEARVYINAPESGTVDVRIYTMRGGLVWETTVEVEAGITRLVNWLCRNKSENIVASGIYIVHIKGAGLDIKKKIAIVK